MSDIVMPMAFDESGSDPATFYATFDGKLTPFWSAEEGLVIWCSSDAAIARLYAPIKAALRYLPAGYVYQDTPVDVNTLLLSTWPTTYTDLASSLDFKLPSNIALENVDETTVQTAAAAILTDMGKDASAAADFIAGDGLLKVEAGTYIGSAAAGDSPDDATQPQQVIISLYDGQGVEMNPVSFFSSAADVYSIDKTLHPILSQLDLESWLEVYVNDEEGNALVGEAYTLYLPDGSTRTGVTDASGRIYETGLSAGDCGLDITNYPSFTLS